jgi:twinkle protein
MNLVIDDDLLAFMGKQESQFLIKPSDLQDEIYERIFTTGSERGDKLPWSKTHKNVRLREGEVSLWVGVNGHGKSNLVGQVAAWGLNKKWLIASMEMMPVVTVERMLKQISAVEHPDINFISKTLRWFDDRLWLYDQTDSVSSDRILALVKYAASIGIDHLVIDSLIKCGIGKEDLDKQTYFVDRLCWLAKTLKIHIHLVHHIRKTTTEKLMPDKFDIRGASEIADLVDNIFIIHRNKNKEEKPKDHKGKPDCWLRVAKQRHHSWEGIYNLWFNPTNGQYTGDENRTMTHWIHNEKMEKQSATYPMAMA